MPILPFGEFKPDVSDYQGQHTKNIMNVMPKGDGYGPVASLAAATSGLAGACRGYFYARKNDGSIQVFAGTATKLYSLNTTDLTWTDVSKSGGSYSALASSAQWQFAQFNNFIIAVQQNTAPQVYDLTMSTEFADLSGSPPQASYISIVNRFVVLSGLISPNVYRVQWSALNDVTGWTSGLNSSDYQDLPDGGIVRGVAGGEYGIIVQDASIRLMTFAQGTPYVFSITRIAQDDGIYAPGSLIAAGDRVFFCSPSGFKMIPPGGYPTPIGKERVDRTFFADVDVNNLQLMIGAHDPKQTRVFWAYKSINGPGAQFDKILCYDWVLDKWSPILTSGEYMASLSRPGTTLEGLDQLYTKTVSSTVTITSANPGLVTWTNHGLTAGSGVNFTTTGGLPTNIVSGTNYFIAAGSTGLTANTFNVSASSTGATISTTAGTQSGVQTAYHSDIDTIALSSLDDISNSAIASLSSVNTSHALGFFTGGNLEATLETPEQGADGKRIFVKGMRPVCDAATIYCSVSQRETPNATSTYSAETIIDANTGVAPQRVSTRYARGKIRVTAATTWTYALGVEPEVGTEGTR
jgi:hypothetical protein